MPRDIDRFLLGSNPLVGVDHFLSERARERRITSTTSRALAVIQAAAESGAEGFTFSPDEVTISILSNLGSIPLPSGFGLYPLIPSLGAYWPTLVSEGPGAMVSAMLKDVGWGARAKATIKGGVSLATHDIPGLLKTYIELEIGRIKRVTPRGNPIRAIFLGEFFTDLVVSVAGVGPLETFCEVIHDQLDLVPGLQTVNFARIVKALEAGGPLCQRVAIMAPFNRIGFQMHPTKDDCERALERCGGHSVVAISILAGGRLGLEEGLSYVRDRKEIHSVVVGASTPTHAREAFHALRA